MINMFIVDPESSTTKSMNMGNPGRKCALFDAATQFAMPTLLATAKSDLSIFQVPPYSAGKTVHVNIIPL